MRKWLRRLMRSGKHTREPVKLADQLRGYPGLWVAVRAGVVVAAAETAYRLVMDLHSRGIEGATILRAPATDEPLRVGLG